MRSGRRQIGIVFHATALLMLSGARAAQGHGLALPFAFWGHFSPAAAGCQRLLGAAATQCATDMWRARNACLLTLVQGGSCDVTATDLSVQQAHLRALDRIDRLCTSPEAQALGFLLKYEAQTDMDVFCRAADDALQTAVYGPAMQNGGIIVVDATTQRCITATAAATVPLLHVAFRAQRNALDRIATRMVVPSDKQVLLDRTTKRIAAIRSALADVIAGTCPADDFNSVYHRDVETVLTGIGQRADCLSGATYVQSALVCPTPVCGNGIRETGEQCDDGNTVNGDGCSSHCTVESLPSP